MRIHVKLFADLLEFAPVGIKTGANIKLDMRQGSTVADLLHTLKIPQGRAKVVFVNGRAQDDLVFALSEGDDIGIFPPVGGG